MILSPEQIIILLEKRYPSISFLQNRDATSWRFREKHVILFRCFNQNSNWVLKFSSLQHLDEETKNIEIDDIRKEYEIGSSFNDHPNFIKTLGCFNVYHDQSLIGICIQSEYFSSTLDQYISNHGSFSQSEVKEFLSQMNSALGYMHYRQNNPVIHADIKPANIGIRFKKNRIEYALMDFDISVRINRNIDHKLLNYSISNKASFRGLTPQYAPPEQIAASMSGSGAITNRVDIYSVGIIALQMITGIAPSKKEGELLFHIPINRVSQPELKNFFNLVCHPNPSIRPKKIFLPSPTKIPHLLYRLQNSNPQNFLLWIALALAGLVIFILIIVISTSSGSTPNIENAPVRLVTDSIGPKPPPPNYLIMPNVLGYNMNYATFILESYGLQIGKIEYQYFLQEYQGLVIATSCTAGYPIPRTSLIDLTIGK